MLRLKSEQHAEITSGLRQPTAEEMQLIIQSAKGAQAKAVQDVIRKLFRLPVTTLDRLSNWGPLRRLLTSRPTA